MASVDGSKSIQGSSDEMFDNTCGPCKEDNIVKGANQYCVDCGVYLCSQCKDVHRKLPLSKNHKVVSDSKKLAGKSLGSQGSGLVFYCGCNTNKEVEFYCEDHNYVMCSLCKSIKHHKCKTVLLQEKSTSYNNVMLNFVLSKTKSLKDKFDKMKRESTDAIKALNLSKEACRKEIQVFRKELNTFLDKLENDLLKDLDKSEEEEQKQLNQHISTLTAALQMLDLDYTLLENAKKDGRKSVMFTSDLQVSKRLQDYDSRLKDLDNDVTKPTLSFERNKKLEDIQTRIKAFGDLRRIDNSTPSLKKQLLVGRKIESRREVNVKSADDVGTPWITGCTVMPSGHIVLCDYNNKKLKVLNTSPVLQETLTLSDRPWDVSVIDNNNVIVTLPDKMQLQYTQVLPQMKAGHIVQFDKQCWGVEVSGNEIFTTYYDDPGKGEVRILELNGNIKRRLGIKPDGSFMFTRPNYVTFSQSGRKIFISDWNTSLVTCITSDGNIIHQYKNDDLKCPHGLLVDAEDNVLVCGSSSCTVQVITADGRKHETLLSSSDLQPQPYSVAYRDSDDTLVVGCHHDKVFLFQLAK